VSFQRKVFLLTSIFFGLLVALILGMVFSPRGTERRAAEALLFPGVKASAVRRIEVSDSTTHVVLQKTASWTMEIAGATFPASQERAESLVRSVVSLNRGTLISRRLQDPASLGFGPQTAKRLAFYGPAGELLCDLALGKAGPSGRGNYVRAGQAPEVWLTGEALSPYLTTERTFWADLRILPRDVTGPAVMRLSISSRTGKVFTWTVAREKDAQNRQVWALLDRAGAKIRQEKVDAIVNAVTGLSGVDFLTGSTDRSAFSNPSAVVVISLTDNRTFSLLFGARQPDGKYPCMREQGVSVYVVPDMRLREILVAEDALMPGSP
jgi:hypothetical protein